MDQPLEGAAQSSKRPWLLTSLVTLWFAAAVGGLFVVTDRPTLLLLAHPQCSCTRATLGELTEALARAQSLPKTYVVTTSTNVFGCSLFAAARS